MMSSTTRSEMVVFEALLAGERRSCIFFAQPLRVLTWLGVWPDAGSLILRIFKKTIGLMALFVSLQQIFSSSVAIYKTGDIIQLGDHIWVLILSLHCIVRRLVINIKYRDLSTLIIWVEENFNAWPIRSPNDIPVPMTADQVRGLGSSPPPGTHPGEFVLSHCLLQSRRVFKYYLSFTFFISNLFPLIPLISNEEPGKRILPYKGWYLVDEQQSPWYEMIYTLLTIGAWVNALYTPAFDLFVAILFQFGTAHLEALQLHLESIQGDHMIRELKFCARYHQRLINYVKLMESILSNFYLYVYISWLFLTPFTLLQIYLMDERKFFRLLAMLMVLGAVIIELFLLCYFAHHLTYQSICLHDSLYNSDWINANSYYKRIMLFFYVGISKPLYLTAKKFSIVSLNMWVAVLKTGYSFYTIIHQI